MLAQAEHVVLAFDVLCAHLGLTVTQVSRLSVKETAACPLFVTWNKGPKLRGCIGTLHCNGQLKTLHAALTDYSLTAALRDRRFSPIVAAELPHLCCTVSLLSSFELAATWDDWDVGTHGLIIEFSDPTGSQRTATFLPEICVHEQWDKKQVTLLT
ncbi:hypothetical protein D9Q98_003876 [Chlorella vulgaris]|uniref:AMMECR1 domain-containing protein n=1 Tax=Chlorella vulgaris TaxID=3077 RepID=A0A9D4TS42_CHLVU|nr:hypothetical protein D9Q98_003876 [Chlorella vulgaris]